jgi:hypothetical protein
VPKLIASALVVASLGCATASLTPKPSGPTRTAPQVCRIPQPSLRMHAQSIGVAMALISGIVLGGYVVVTGESPFR